jgi:hypothetical protein
MPASKSVSRVPRPALRHLAAAAVCAAAVFGLLATAAVGYRAMKPWRDRLDPRQRLLWDSDLASARIVLLGDSVFAPTATGQRQDLLESQLQQRTPLRVFGGALRGARPRDFLAAVEYVSAHVQPGTIVFVDIEPVRFFRLGPSPVRWEIDQGPTRPGGLTGTLQATQDPVTEPFVERIDGALRGRLERTFGLNASYRAWNDTFNEIVRTRRATFSPAIDGYDLATTDRVWTHPDGFAKRQFLRLSPLIRLDVGPPPFDWVIRAHALLAAADARLVVVLTPWCEDLIRAYAPHDLVAPLLAKGNARAARAADTFRAAGVGVLDLRHALPQPCFSDLIHPNACGNVAIAEHLVAYIGQADGTAGSAGERRGDR